MKVFLFFTHPDSSAAESSLSASGEGEEGESILQAKNLLV
jgi:hypothetical protein